MEEMMDLIKKLFNEVDFMNAFCYLGNRLYSRGSCETAVTARVRNGWVRFKKCGVIAWK